MKYNKILLHRLVWHEHTLKLQTNLLIVLSDFSVRVQSQCDFFPFLSVLPSRLFTRFHLFFFTFDALPSLIRGYWFQTRVALCPLSEREGKRRSYELHNDQKRFVLHVNTADSEWLARTIIAVAAEHESRPKSEVIAIPPDPWIPQTHSNRFPLLTRQIKRRGNPLVTVHRCDSFFFLLFFALFWRQEIEIGRRKEELKPFHYAAINCNHTWSVFTCHADKIFAVQVTFVIKNLF